MIGGPYPAIKGVFTPEAEMMNGRAAMIGLIALAVGDAVAGGVLF